MSLAPQVVQGTAQAPGCGRERTQQRCLVEGSLELTPGLPLWVWTSLLTQQAAGSDAWPAVWITAFRELEESEKMIQSPWFQSRQGRSKPSTSGQTVWHTVIRSWLV